VLDDDVDHSTVRRREQAVTRYAAFLRAINVGGHTVKMEKLRSIFEEVALEDVRTVINSGNVLFSSDAEDIGALERKLEAALESALGYAVATFVRSKADVRRAARRAPFGEVPESELVQVGFLRSAPTAAVRKAVVALETERDELRIHGRELYWHVRGRTMDSLLKPKSLDRALGGPTTMRNTKTVRRVADLLSEQ
jgi:uncharacterized protein (DUF1697 family)